MRGTCSPFRLEPEKQAAEHDNHQLNWLKQAIADHKGTAPVMRGIDNQQGFFGSSGIGGGSFGGGSYTVSNPIPGSISYNAASLTK